MFRNFAVAVLTASVLAATPVAAGVVAFSGSYSNDTPPPAPNPACSPGTVLVSFSPSNSTAAGVSNFGAFGPSLSHCISPPPSTYQNGNWLFEFEQGDWLAGLADGAVTPTATPGIFDVSVAYIVTGGSGRFLGASGTIYGVGTLDRTVARPLNSQQLSGTLNLPAVPEPAAWAQMLAGFAVVGAIGRRRRVPALVQA